MKLTQLEKDKIERQKELTALSAQQRFFEEQKAKGLVKCDWWLPRKDLGKGLRFQARLCLEHERSLKK